MTLYHNTRVFASAFYRILNYNNNLIKSSFQWYQYGNYGRIPNIKVIDSPPMTLGIYFTGLVMKFAKEPKYQKVLIVPISQQRQPTTVI